MAFNSFGSTLYFFAASSKYWSYGFDFCCASYRLYLSFMFSEGDLDGSSAKGASPPMNSLTLVLPVNRSITLPIDCPSLRRPSIKSSTSLVNSGDARYFPKRSIPPARPSIHLPSSGDCSTVSMAPASASESLLSCGVNGPSPRTNVLRMLCPL